MYTKLILPNGDIHIIRVDLRMPINYLKNEIKNFYNIFYDIELLYNGISLNNEKTIHECHIWPDSKINLFIRNINLNPDAPTFFI